MTTRTGIRTFEELQADGIARLEAAKQMVRQGEGDFVPPLRTVRTYQRPYEELQAKDTITDDERLARERMWRAWDEKYNGALSEERDRLLSTWQETGEPPPEMHDFPVASDDALLISAAEAAALATPPRMTAETARIKTDGELQGSAELLELARERGGNPLVIDPQLMAIEREQARRRQDIATLRVAPGVNIVGSQEWVGNVGASYGQGQPRSAPAKRTDTKQSLSGGRPSAGRIASAQRRK